MIFNGIEMVDGDIYRFETRSGNIILYEYKKNDGVCAYTNGYIYLRCTRRYARLLHYYSGKSLLYFNHEIFNLQKANENEKAMFENIKSKNFSPYGVSHNWELI